MLGNMTKFINGLIQFEAIFRTPCMGTEARPFRAMRPDFVIYPIGSLSNHQPYFNFLTLVEIENITDD